MNVCICGGDVARLRPIHVTHVNESSHTHHRVMPHISMSHVAHINASYHAYQRVMSHAAKVEERVAGKLLRFFETSTGLPLVHSAVCDMTR